jgi:flagellar basal-body rod modification protein FlgD
MEIGGVDNMTYGLSSTESAPVKDAMDKDAFLRLLVTQLKNQDPLKPADNTEFVAQLAQFSSLEGITNLNTSMEDISKSITSMQDLSSATLVGRYVKTAGNVFEYAEDVPAEYGFTLEGDASNAKITIADEMGRVVRDIDAGAMSAGDHLINWDGKDNSGVPVGQGVYSFKVSAIAQDKKTVAAAPYTIGLVSSVSLAGGATGLNVNGQTITKDMIKEIY